MTDRVALTRCELEKAHRVGEPAQARQVLRKLLVGRLVWTPARDAAGGVQYAYRCDVSYDRVVAGIVGVHAVNIMVPPERYAAHAKRLIDALVA